MTAVTGSSGPVMVSVVIPAFRAAGYIGAALESVFAQTLPPFEVIVVNDGSPDVMELRKALEPYEDRVRYVERRNGGPSAARNTGLNHALAPWVAFLDADDAWHPDFLEMKTRYISEHPGIDLVYSDARIFGDSDLAGTTVMSRHPSAGDVSVARLLLADCTVITSAVVARRGALLRAGGFDERLTRAEDLDLWIRLLRTGGRIGYQKLVLVERHMRDDSLSSDAVGMLEAFLDLLNRLEPAGLEARDLEALESARGTATGNIALLRGKQALRDGDIPGALTQLGIARRLVPSWKLALAVPALKLSPGLFRRLLSGRAGSRTAPRTAER
jgi:glycosyltransferase involved in cell wall biosynthesis